MVNSTLPLFSGARGQSATGTEHRMTHPAASTTASPCAPRSRHSPNAEAAPAASLPANWCSHGARSVPATGLTLIEMLVALAVTMVMMAAVVNLFANISGSIRNRRAVIEVSAQLRQARMRLAKDLAGATCEATTWQRPEENRGYIEIIEGRYSDKWPSNFVDGDPDNGEIDGAISIVPSTQTVDTTTGAVTDGGGLGDWDDVLALTVRSEAEPFVAEVEIQNVTQTVTSTLAEVVWCAAQEDNGPAAGMRKIYRRALLIAPWLGPWPVHSELFDPSSVISVRIEPVPPESVTLPDGTQATITKRYIANTLGDLTKRENRISRQPNDSFPFPLDRNNLGGQNPDYLMLGDALAFDVRVYDPGAPLYPAVDAPNTIVEPSDRGWLRAAQTNNLAGKGAFCDLGWNWDVAAGMQNSGVTVPPDAVFYEPRRAGWHKHRTDSNTFLAFPAVYDTWSYHYENDNVSQYNDGYSDRGTNGIDDDNQYGVDDLGERETFPPYNVPLRGVKVIMRIYERDARQTREVSVTHSF